MNDRSVGGVDGSFELTADITSPVIEYGITDEFGNHYSGNIDYPEYMDRSGSNSCFISSCD